MPLCALFLFSTTTAATLLALVLLLLFKLLGRWVLGGYDGYPFEEQVLGFDVTVDDTTLLMQVSDAMSDLKDDVTREVLAEVRQLDDLVEELAALHHCGVRESAQAPGVEVELSTVTGRLHSRTKK